MSFQQIQKYEQGANSIASAHPDRPCLVAMAAHNVLRFGGPDERDLR